MSAAPATRLVEEHAAVAAALPAEVVSRDQRLRAIQLLAEKGLPTSRDENWRYANLRPLDRVRFVPRTTPAARTIAASDLPARINGYARVTFVDGLYVPELSDDAPTSGVSIESLRARGAAHSPSVYRDLPEARLALLNDAFATDGVAIHVGANVDCPACIEVVFVATEDAQAGASYPRLHLGVGPNARLGLIERHVSIGGEANFVNASVNVSIGRGAKVEHYRVQQMGSAATWFDTLTASIADSGVYALRFVGLGAASARSTMHVQLAGERAEVALDVVSVAGQRQVHDGLAMIEHLKTHGRTDQMFRGIASDRARVAFNSKVIVREGARGTDSRQSLRGLLAGPEAEIDVRPQLEIYNDDVKCSHGATAGKLDDTMLFYLLSRGLDRQTAQRLLEWAFLEDVVAKIAVPELRRQIEQSLAGRMSDSAALQELF
jgi:Fe-S cluster assembly protein SufD